MVPAEALTALNEGLAAVATVAAMAFLVIVSIAAFRYMRSAVGYSDSQGNKYRSKEDRDEAENYAFENYSDTYDSERFSSPADSDAHYAELQKSEKASGFDESLNQGFDETDDEYGDRLEVRESLREDYGVKN